MDHVYVSDWAIQIPWWALGAALFLLVVATWKLVTWGLALLR